MRIAVTGGSGRIGRAIVRLAVAEGHQAVSIDRVAAPGEQAESSAIEFVQADLTDYQSFETAIQGCDASSPASSASETASSGEIGRGTLRGFFGPLSRGSEASLPCSCAAKARKPRIAESSRAAEELPSPVARRLVR